MYIYIIYIIIGKGYNTPHFETYSPFVPNPHFRKYSTSGTPILFSNPIHICQTHSYPYLLLTTTFISPSPHLYPPSISTSPIPNSNHILVSRGVPNTPLKNPVLVWNHQVLHRPIPHVKRFERKYNQVFN